MPLPTDFIMYDMQDIIRPKYKKIYINKFLVDKI